MRNYRRNLFFTLIYDAVDVLYPYFGILIGPILAVFAITSSWLFVVPNALRYLLANIQETATPYATDEVALTFNMQGT